MIIVHFIKNIFLKNWLDLSAIDSVDCEGKTPLYEALEQKNKIVLFELRCKGASNFGSKNLLRKLLLK